MKRKLTLAKDKEAKNHELHCWIHDTPFSQRTIYTCNCTEKDVYKKEFYNNRTNTKKATS